ncbi:DinB family protein [Pontibacter anaerobius]|uniref:DinB family protein n=1 Tax=Pontibacter anaerobius TaxID=2993940 RepID=A0ABT3RCE7_9BACT|nr:DinB family protein [Pontibacter anaerobius]MCX2739119.1 DinB family protein [Pontibacter anaerobius]
MNPKLEDKYLHLEESRNRLLDELAGLDDAQLNTATSAGKWSINQHVAHLVLVEERALDNIRYKLSRQEELQNVGLNQIVRAFLMKLALQSGRKYKAPAVVAAVPNTCHLPALRQQWDKARFELEDELTGFPNQLLEKGIFKHPMVGYLTISQTLTFLQDHFIHHKRIMQAQKQALVG